MSAQGGIRSPHADNRVASGLDILMTQARAGLDLHFGEGFAEANPVLVIAAAFLLVQRENGSIARENGSIARENVSTAHENVSAAREGHREIAESIYAHGRASSEGFEAVCEAVAELAVVIAGQNI